MPHSLVRSARDLLKGVEGGVDDLDYWRLLDEFNVIQAALLIIPEDPTVFQEDVLDNKPQDRPRGFDAAYTALINAIKSGRLKASIRYISKGEASDLNPKLTLIKEDDLKGWLPSRGIRTSFFFPKATDTPSYLDPDHPHYTVSLAAPIFAWRAMEDDALLEGKTPKQALEKWLTENAARFGLTDEDGNPKEKLIKKHASTANWKKGGPRTPNS